MRGTIIAMTRTAARGRCRLARWILGAAAFGALSAAVGCGGGPEMPRIAEGIYSGPVLSVDTSGRHHVVVMEAPTPGWEITLDRDLEVREYRQAFVSVTRPNPALVYPQVIVKQNLLTSVESRYPVRVFARVLDYQSGATDGEYKLAADGAARVGPPVVPNKPGVMTPQPVRPDEAKPDAPGKSESPAKPPVTSPTPEVQKPEAPKPDAPKPAESVEPAAPPK